MLKISGPKKLIFVLLSTPDIHIQKLKVEGKSIIFILDFQNKIFWFIDFFFDSTKNRLIYLKNHLYDTNYTIKVKAAYFWFLIGCVGILRMREM